MPYKLSYLDTDPRKRSNVVGQWFFKEYTDVLDALEEDYDDNIKVYAVVIVYVPDESVPFCIE